LVADGTYLKHEHCIYSVTDYLSGLTVKYGFGARENYAMTYSIFAQLKASGGNPKAITIDGNTTVIRALRAVWPTILIQRCLYHILRQGTSWLRRFPKDQSAKELRQIFLMVTSIKNQESKETFLNRFAVWEQTFGSYVKSLDGHHKVWGDIQRARSLLLHALPDMFHFLSDPNIAPTSNIQEGFFSTVKIIFRNHRGVRKTNRDSYFSWYFYFKNKNIFSKKQPKGY
jgi:transposase-like protein